MSISAQRDLSSPERPVPQRKQPVLGILGGQEKLRQLLCAGKIFECGALESSWTVTSSPPSSSICPDVGSRSAERR